MAAAIFDTPPVTYLARVQGERVESLSLNGAFRGACQLLRLDESAAFTVQKDPGTWLVVADPRDAFGCALITIASPEM